MEQFDSIPRPSEKVLNGAEILPTPPGGQKRTPTKLGPVIGGAGNPIRTLKYEPPDAKAALALIPARGGSKGIPGKNLQEVGELPLVVRCIHAAQASHRVTRVVVSTDDDAIAGLSRDAGAHVVQRPKSISGDSASSESALLHALDDLACQNELEANLVFLQCTSPFTTGAEIDKVLEALDQPEINSSFAVAPWHGFLWRADGNGINHDPNAPRQRRQDLEPSYLETGAIYAMRTANFRAVGQRFCPPWQPVVLANPGPEIDSPQDLALCRSLASVLSS